MTNYRECYLACHNGHSHAILLRCPSLVKKSRNPPSSSTGNQTAVFLCPDCGLGSAYSPQEVREQVIAGRPGLFERGECILVSVEIECDGNNCKAPKLIHTIHRGDTGNWKPKVGLEGWHFDESAQCGDNHQLRLDRSRSHDAKQTKLPF